jgi:hypothetical protein
MVGVIALFGCGDRESIDSIACTKGSPVAVAASPAGFSLVTGQSVNMAMGVRVERFTTSGDRLTSFDQGHPLGDYDVQRAVETGEGGVILAGHIDYRNESVNGLPNPAITDRSFLTRFDAVGGLVWNRMYGGRYDFLTEAILHPRGGYLFAGRADTVGWIGRVDADGTLLWDATLPTFGNVSGIAVLPDDGLVIVGHTQQDGTVGLIAWLGAEGQLQSSVAIPEALATAIAVVPGGVIIVYEAFDGGAHVARFDPRGDTIWEARYAPEFENLPSSVVVATGRILVAGHSDSEKFDSPKAFAVEYTLDGAQQNALVSDGDRVGLVTEGALFAHGNERFCVTAL